MLPFLALRIRVQQVVRTSARLCIEAEILAPALRGVERERGCSAGPRVSSATG